MGDSFGNSQNCCGWEVVLPRSPARRAALPYIRGTARLHCRVPQTFRDAALRKSPPGRQRGADAV